MLLLLWTNCYMLDQLKVREIEGFFYLHLFLFQCFLFLYVDPSFWSILFSFSIKNFLKAGLLATNFFFFFFLSEKVFILLHSFCSCWFSILYILAVKAIEINYSRFPYKRSIFLTIMHNFNIMIEWYSIIFKYRMKSMTQKSYLLQWVWGEIS